MKDQPLYLNTSQVAKLSGLSVDQIRHRCKIGMIKTQVFGTEYMIHQSQIPKIHRIRSKKKKRGKKTAA